MAKIRIRNMMLYAFHGIYEYEREQGQKFFLDIELETRDNHAAETDAVEDGVDGAIVYEHVRNIFETDRCTLMQTIATKINKELLRLYPQCSKATTVVRKPSAAIPGPLDFLEVEVTTAAD